MQMFRGLRSVRISKEFLLEKLKENRETHKAQFEAALNGWHVEVIKSLESTIERVKKDKRHNPNFYLPMPENHTTEYDQVIEMVEASLDKEFELTTSEFAQYVRDDWGWKADFINVANSYTVGK